MGDCPENGHDTRERRRKLLGRWRWRRRKTEEEEDSEMWREFELNSLPEHLDSSDDDSVCETTITSASERGRRIAVTEQPVIVEICQQPPPGEARHDGHSDQHENSPDVDVYIDKADFDDQDKNTAYVQLEQVWSLQERFQQSEDLKDSSEEDQEPPMEPSPVAVIPSPDSVADEPHPSKSDSSSLCSKSDCSSQGNVDKLLKALADQDSDIDISDDEFQETPWRLPVSCSGDYVSGSSIGASSAYTGMSSYSPPQLHRPP